MLNLPNLFSLVRIVLILPFLLLLQKGSYGAAFAVGFLAALTDFFDGVVARRLGQQTVLGAYLDPAADKLFMTASFLFLPAVGLLPAWLSALVIGRDVMIVLGILVIRLLSIPLEVRPTRASKITTGLQLATIGAPLFSASLYQMPWLTEVLIFASASGTIFSGWQYLSRGIRVLRRGKN